MARSTPGQKAHYEYHRRQRALAPNLQPPPPSGGDRCKRCRGQLLAEAGGFVCLACGNRKFSPERHPLPDVRGRNYEEPSNVTAHRSTLNPPASAVDAMDARWGRAGWQEEEFEEEKKFNAAMITLAAYNPAMADVVNMVCVRGRWRFTPDGWVRHHTVDDAAAYIGQDADGEDVEIRTVENWCAFAWEVLGLLLLPSQQELLAALEAHEVTRRAYRRLKEAGLV